MRKVLLAWFSQTGATHSLAQRIFAGLTAAGCEVTNLEIGKSVLPGISGFDAIGIGSPTYIFRPPFAVTDFVKSLPDLSGKLTFVFLVHGTFQGAGGNRIRRLLAAKNGRDLGYFHCYGADYFIGYLKRGYLFSPESPTRQELAAAEQFARALPERASQQTAVVEPFDPRTGFLHAIERMLANRTFAKLIYGTSFHADKNCDNCGICIAACPNRNISLRGESRPRWGRNCMLCVTCELKCPRDAVHSPYDWPVFAPLISYNVRHAIRGAIPFEKVTFSGGVTKRPV